MLKITKLMIILMAGLFAPIASAQDIPDAGIWTYQEDTDKFTDEVKHTLFLTSEETSAGKDVSMLISCGDNRTTIIMIANGYTLKSSRNREDTWEADYRLDDLKAHKFNAYASRDAFFPTPLTLHIPFIKDMFNRDKLLMRFEIYDGTRETATFKIADIETAIKPIRTECNW